MTNKDKFIKIFGVEPDIDNCPILCAADNFDCPYVKTSCYSGKWWNEEYKIESEKNIEVNEDGIYYVMSDPYQNGRMICQARLIITKEAFIEAYNKYIKEENHVDTDTEQTEDDK